MIFKKCETPQRTIAYMAIMAAINVIFVVITTFVPILLFLLVFVLPLTSTIVTIFCKKKYYIIYAVATLGLCMLTTIWNISDTLFYVLPSLITGFIFGYGIEKGFPAVYLILLTSLIQVGFTYASVPLIKLLTNINIIETFLKIFHIENYKYVNYLIPTFILFIGITQSTLSFGVIQTQIPKLHIQENNGKLPRFLDSFVIILAYLIFLLFVFVYPNLSLFFLCVLLFLSIYKIATIITEMRKLKIILLIVAFVITFVLFVSLNSLVPKPNSINLISVFPILIGIIDFIQ